MEKLDQYSKLVYPTWVKQVIDYHAPGSTTPAPVKSFTTKFASSCRLEMSNYLKFQVRYQWTDRLSCKNRLKSNPDTAKSL